MQALIHDRSGLRIAILALVVLLGVAVSWGMARNGAPALPSERSGEDLTRLGLSADAQIQTFQDRLRSDPEDWQSYSQLGLAYLQKAREVGDPTYYQKAEEALNQALSHQPDEYVAVSGMGALALARHQFQEALEWGERARRINPDRAYAYGVIVDAQVELGQYDEAVETLQTMVDLHPDMSSFTRVSYLRELHGDTSGALEMMQSAVDSGVPNAENTAWTRTQLGNLYFNMGDLENAEAQYLLTLQNWPDYLYAMAGLARVRAAQGQLDDAIELMKRTTEIMPLPDFVILLGDLYQANGQTEMAGQQYRLVGAIETLYRANGVDMDMEIALFNADHRKNLEDTLELARQAYANRPSIHAADVLAWALYQTGAYEEAHTYSDLALELGTQDALKFFHAGMIAYQLGDHMQARTDLEQALELNPHFSILYADEAQQTLDALPLQAEGGNNDSP
ncbi:MAG: tetratricopeptide repeat protein [Chloroflexota bacterium]